LVLRHAQMADHPSVVGFFRSQPSPFLRERPDAELLDAIEQRRFLIIETVRPSRIVAAIAGFNMDQCLPDLVVQVGAVRVADEFQGLGLARILLSTMLLTIYKEEQELELVYAAVRGDNKPSIAMVTRGGFAPWTPDHPELRAFYAEALAGNATETAPEKRKGFFRFDPARLPDHASTLLIGDRLLTQKRTERDFRLAFNVRLVNDQEAKDWLIRVSEGEESFRGWGG
jgi:ribosomal protein S18 acetylase RimI-like enzyme